jgi:hypothetical protein
LPCECEATSYRLLLFNGAAPAVNIWAFKNKCHRQSRNFFSPSENFLNLEFIHFFKSI